jgi:release factor glutamine methyltransferase
MLKIKDIRIHLKNCLGHQYPDNELRGFGNWILEHLFDYTITDALLNADRTLTEKNSSDLEFIIKHLKQEKPIQQIVGYSWFYGRKFLLNEHVLIPRPETEELVDWMLKDSLNDRSILEVGTGSGCIAITLALNTNATIVSIDVSELALKQAKTNALALNASVAFCKADVLDDSSCESFGCFDVIVSNPPYVLESDKQMMSTNVLEYEPHLALFVSSDDPLLFYRAIATMATRKLNANGVLYFEIHENYGQEALDMLSLKGFKELELRKDLQGKDRMVKAVWKL